MAQTIQKPRGTADSFPLDSAAYREIEELYRGLAGNGGFGEIRFPTFESTALFSRSAGETSDVVSKEMYSFCDNGGDSLTLRPEGTACVVRAMIESGQIRETMPQKLFYFTSCFRYNRPQAGRLREFHQFGCEIFGGDSYVADAELIALANRGFAALGIADSVMTRLNSIGCPTCRGEYKKALVAFFESKKEQLCPTCNERLYKNPMRILDCKSPECRAIAAGAPRITDYLCEHCRGQLDGLRGILDGLGVRYEMDDGIVRGLDYYNGPVFEFVTDKLGAQDAVGGGGRYDGLVTELGGPPTAACGFALGLERLLMLREICCGKTEKPADCRLFIIPMGEETRLRAAQLADAVRAAGLTCVTELTDRSLKASMRYANKLGAAFTLVIGGDELAAGSFTLKQMTGEGGTAQFSSAEQLLALIQ